jgi:hypothetical protein
MDANTPLDKGTDVDTDMVTDMAREGTWIRIWTRTVPRAWVPGMFMDIRMSQRYGRYHDIVIMNLSTISKFLVSKITHIRGHPTLEIIFLKISRFGSSANPLILC